jgi:hypothetical protein
MNALKFIQVQTNTPAIGGASQAFQIINTTFSKDIFIDHIYCDFLVTDVAGAVRPSQSIIDLTFTGGNVGSVPTLAGIGGWPGGSFTPSRIGFQSSNGFKEIRPKIIIPQGVTFNVSVTLYAAMVAGDPIAGSFRIGYR